MKLLAFSIVFATLFVAVICELSKSGLDFDLKYIMKSNDPHERVTALLEFDGLPAKDASEEATKIIAAKDKDKAIDEATEKYPKYRYYTNLFEKYIDSGGIRANLEKYLRDLTVMYKKPQLANKLVEENVAKGKTYDKIANDVYNTMK